MNTKQLKQKILSLAITGRLVPQDPRDEPASELLHRINPKATLVQGDAPFDVPDSWSWCRLGRVCDIARGGSPRPIKKYLTDAENGVNWIKIGDTKPDDKYVRSVKQKIKPEGVSRSRFVHKGDFLLTNSMSFGRPYILDVDGCIHDGWLVISPKGGVYDKDFLYYLLSSPFAYDQFSREAGGGVVDNLNSEKVSNTVFPIPPLAEQKRIAEAVERWFAKIDQLEHDCEALSKFGKQVRKKLLTAAIAGRLVPQDPNDEPASELIYRINSKATLVQGDAPFDVPDSWSWCRLGRVCDIARGGSPRPIKKYLTDAENGVNWIKIGDTKPDDKYVRSVKQKIKPEGVSRSRFVHKGDFLLTNSMSFGRPYILDVDGCIHDGWLVISPKGGVYDKDFLYYLLSSPFAYDQFSREAGGGVVDNLNSEKVSNTVFPIPPLAEQKRIVEKLESMFAVLDNLDALTA